MAARNPDRRWDPPVATIRVKDCYPSDLVTEHRSKLGGDGWIELAERSQDKIR